MVSEHTAKIILECIADDRGLAWRARTASKANCGDRVMVEVFDPNGPELWRATGSDFYAAACALAELMGWDLEDG